MNFSSILSEIERLDPEIYERTSERRSVIKRWTRTVTLAALPLALGSLFKKAYGQSTPDILIETLNFALTLEYLESEFYKQALLSKGTPGKGDQLIPSGSDETGITLIAKHERQHVAFLQQVIAGAGGKVATQPKFDFTGGNGDMNGPFAAVFSNYGVFLAVAQTFEDTGVRAYKGSAPILMNNHDMLRGALRIHSVEARHAAHIRMMRANTPGPFVSTPAPKPWITRDLSGINSSDVQASYVGEETTLQGPVSPSTLQGTIQITGINGLPITADAASESFDEPLFMAQVLKIVDPFIV